MSSEQPPSYAAVDNQTPASEPPKLGFFARLTNVLFSPSETFADVNRAPKPLMPILALMVITIIFSMINSWRVHPDYHQMVVNQMEQQLAAQGKTLKDIPDNQRQGMEVGMKVQETIFRYRAFIFPLFSPIFLAIIALLLWVGTLLLQCQTTYVKIFSVVAWSSLGTGIVKGLLGLLGTFIRQVDPTDLQEVLQGGITTNLGPLVPKSSNIVLHAGLEQLDVFMIWVLILTSIGLAAISRKKKTSQVAIIPFGIWAIVVVLRLGVAVVFKN